MAEVLTAFGKWDLNSAEWLKANGAGPSSYADIMYTVLHFSPYTAFHYLLYTAGTQFWKTIFSSASNFTRNMGLTYHLHMLPIGLVVL
jgi:hypothetical protein